MKSGDYYTIKYRGELAIVELKHPLFQAEVSVQGAQVSSFSNHLGSMLWCTDQGSNQSKKAIRGGIPLCFPYFGAHKTLKNAPSHGFARISDFRLVNVSEDSQSVVLKWALNQDDVSEFKEIFPFNFTLLIIQTFSTTLTIDVIVTNDDSKTLAFSQALHSYFAVSSLPELDLSDFFSFGYYDQLTQKYVKGEKVQIDHEVDRIYDVPDPLSITTPLSSKVTLTLVQAGASNIVMWNPFIEKAKRLSDMRDDAYTEMLCLESANTQEIVLEPQASHQLSLTLSLSERV